MNNGQAVSGNLVAGGTDNYFFNPSANSTFLYDLVVETTLGTLSDSVVELQNAYGAQLAYDDDGGGNLASKLIKTIVAGNSGSSGYYYYPKVRGYSSSQAGTYTVKATWTPTPITSLPANGTWISGNIESGRVSDWYRFESDGLHEFTIETALGSLSDTVIELYQHPNTSTYERDLENYIAYNDDNGSSYASTLVVTPPSDDNYYNKTCPTFLRVRAYGSSQTGTYSVRMSSRYILSSSIIPLTVNGAAVSGSAQGSVWCAFSVPRNGVYTINRTGVGVTSLYGPNSQSTLISSVSSQYGLVKSLTPGIYYIQLQSISGNYTVDIDL